MRVPSAHTWLSTEAEDWSGLEASSRPASPELKCPLTCGYANEARRGLPLISDLMCHMCATDFASCDQRAEHPLGIQIGRSGPAETTRPGHSPPLAVIVCQWSADQRSQVRKLSGLSELPFVEALDEQREDFIVARRADHVDRGD